MINDPKLSFLLLEPINPNVSVYENKINCERTCSVLWSKEYSVIPVKEYNNYTHNECFLGISNLSNNDEIRTEALNILNFLNLEYGILKYVGESHPVKIHKSGQEDFLETKIYESNEDNKVYMIDGLSFSFITKNRYFYPRLKEHLKKGMIVEYYNNNIWNQKTINDLDSEYDKLYRLMIQYEKLRILI
jgi:hypothetical protein